MGNKKNTPDDRDKDSNSYEEFPHFNAPNSSSWLGAVSQHTVLRSHSRQLYGRAANLKPGHEHTQAPAATTLPGKL
jgi:hypothetical protein